MGLAAMKDPTTQRHLILLQLPVQLPIVFFKIPGELEYFFKTVPVLPLPIIVLAVIVLELSLAIVALLLQTIASPAIVILIW